MDLDPEQANLSTPDIPNEFISSSKIISIFIHHLVFMTDHLKYTFLCHTNDAFQDLFSEKLYADKSLTYLRSNFAYSYILQKRWKKSYQVDAMLTLKLYVMFCIYLLLKNLIFRWKLFDSLSSQNFNAHMPFHRLHLVWPPNCSR